MGFRVQEAELQAVERYTRISLHRHLGKSRRADALATTLDNLVYLMFLPATKRGGPRMACWPSQKEIGARRGVSREQANRDIACLSSLNYIIKKRRRAQPDKRWPSNLYKPGKRLWRIMKVALAWIRGTPRVKSSAHVVAAYAAKTTEERCAIGSPASRGNLDPPHKPPISAVVGPLKGTPAYYAHRRQALSILQAWHDRGSDQT